MEDAALTQPVPWKVCGSYYEVCNCTAICPCRRQADRKGGRSTFGTCDFALSWLISEGHSGNVDLTGLGAVMAGSYSDDEPGEPWRVILYVDARADLDQQRALSDIFLGRAGGGTLRNFAAAIGEVYAIRPAHLDLDHTPNAESMRASKFLSASTAHAVATDEPISCGIPGHDQPGQEIVATQFRVDDAPLRWDVSGRCGFATAFAYSSTES